MAAQRFIFQFPNNRRALLDPKLEASAVKLNDEIDILLLEDSPTDVKLIEHALRRGVPGFQVEHVDNKRAFIRRLKRQVPDLILSDFSLPTIDGYTALAIAQKHCPDVPFIFVSGTLDISSAPSGAITAGQNGNNASGATGGVNTGAPTAGSGNRILRYVTGQRGPDVRFGGGARLTQSYFCQASLWLSIQR